MTSCYFLFVLLFLFLRAHITYTAIVSFFSITPSETIRQTDLQYWIEQHLTVGFDISIGVLCSNTIKSNKDYPTKIRCFPIIKSYRILLWDPIGSNTTDPSLRSSPGFLLYFRRMVGSHKIRQDSLSDLFTWDISFCKILESSITITI